MKHIRKFADEAELNLKRSELEKIFLVNYAKEVLTYGGGGNSVNDKITYEFVDLDLPSHTLWMKTNLGARTETEYGGYYQFGGLEPIDLEKYFVHLSTAPFNNGKDTFDSDYFNTIKDTVLTNFRLNGDYDAVYKETNGEGRIASGSQMKELIDNTNHEWFDNFNNSGIKGMKFSSKKNTEKYIFVPAGGTKEGLFMIEKGESAYLLSNQVLSKNLGYAAMMLADNKQVKIGGTYRGRAVPLRGVKRLKVTETNDAVSVTN